MKYIYKFAIALVLVMGACSKKTYEGAGMNKGTSTADGKEMVAVQSLQPDGITEKYWKLIELNGAPVVLGENDKREPFILLKAEGSRVNGNTGCNTISGSYELDAAANRIKFTQMVTTQMMCLNMEIENNMKKVFESVDNYTVSPDGKYLSLNRARMAPLARFEVVYLR